jgi:hypothetical protein
MTQQAFERGEWQAVIDAHPLESHDPAEWLRYGAALLHTLEPGPEQGRQQQQAALAFVQAQKEGALAAEVVATQRQVVEQSLAAALTLVDVPHPPLRQHQVVGPPVTLTAISGRLASLPAVLESLRQQTYRPERVHLHLSHEPHLLDQGVADNEPLLEEITADGWVQLHWVANSGPYRKIVPFLQTGGYGQGKEHDLFITVDDDTLYPPRFIEYLVRHHARHGCVVAHRGRRIRLAEAATAGSPFLPYANWHDGVREPRLANLPTGQSGVLYRRSWFPEDLELEAALALAPSHDDLWLRWLTARQGVEAVILQPNAAANTNELAFPAASPEPIAGEQTLWHQYNGPAGGNDEAVQAVQAYWQARGFDLAALLAEEQERQADFY